MGQGLRKRIPRPKGEDGRPLEDRIFPIKGCGLMTKTIQCCVTPWASPPGRPDATANIATMGTAGDDGDGHWRADVEPEEHRGPRITEPSTPIDTGHEEVDFMAARPREEALGLSHIRDTVRARAGSVPPGFPSGCALTALEVVDLMEERHRARDKEKRLCARLPRLEETPKTYAEVELFLTAIE